MPTPMPIMADTEGAQSGTSITAASMPTSDPEIASPNSAVAIGIPVATSVPNVNASTPAAISMPVPSEDVSPFLGVGDHAAAHLDSQPAAVRALAQGQQLLAALLGHVV